MKETTSSLPFFPVHIADITTARGYVKVAADDAAFAALFRFMLHSWVHGPVADGDLEDVCGPGFAALRSAMLDRAGVGWVLSLLERRRTEQDAVRAKNSENAKLGQQRKREREQAEAERSAAHDADAAATAQRPHSDRSPPLATAERSQATASHKRIGEQRREDSGACPPTALPVLSGTSASDDAEAFPAPQVLRESEAERPQRRNGDPAPERVGVRDGTGLWDPLPPSKRAEPIEVEAVPDDGSAEPASPKRKRGGGGGNAMTRHWDAEWARLRPDHGPFPWTNGHAVALARCAKFPGSSPEEVCRRITRILASQEPFHLRAATPCVLRQQWSNLPADIVRPMTERERILATPIPDYPYPPSRP